MPPAGTRFPPQRHGGTRSVEDGDRVGWAVHARPASTVGNAQRVAVVLQARARETSQPPAGQAGVVALGVVGHYGEPAARWRSARVQCSLVHVPVCRMRPCAALVLVHLIAVVPKPHVVPQLMREGKATTTL